jgi:hypothetical protein
MNRVLNTGAANLQTLCKPNSTLAQRLAARSQSGLILIIITTAIIIIIIILI